MLSDWSLIQALRQGTLKLLNHEDANIQPVSIDVHLGNQYIRYKDLTSIFNLTGKLHVDPEEDVSQLMVGGTIGTKEEGGFVLPPCGFILAAIEEHITVGNDLAGLMHGLSSVARLGIFVHAQAGLLDPGWEGRATLEIFNGAPVGIKLWAGMPIATVTMHETTTKVAVPYGHPSRNSKYQGDDGVTASRYHRKLDEQETKLKQGAIGGPNKHIGNKDR